MRPARSRTKRRTTSRRTCSRTRVPSSTRAGWCNSRRKVRSISEPFPLPLGVLTELAVDASRCTFEVKDGYAVIRTPQNPGYYNGNYLYFPQAPQRGDLALWLERFEQAFAADARVKHGSFCWDGAAGTGAAGDFVAAGFTLDEYLIMTAQTLNDFAPPANIHLR